jgi:PAS domain S-box-containing protein
MKYRLQDLIDVEQFQSLQDRLNQIYAFPSAIIDNDGNILTATCWQDICTKFHRVNKESEKECIKSDQYILGHLHEADPAVSYRCPHGLIDNATPIIIEGVHYGNFFTGQFFLEKPAPAFFKEQARKYGFDEGAYLAAVQKVPVWTTEQLHSYLYFIKGLIEVISSVGLRNLREKESRRQLLASEEKFRALFESAKDGIFQLSAKGDLVALNASFAGMHGYTFEEMLKMNLKDLDTPETAALAPARTQRLLAGEPLTFEVEHYCKNGRTIPLEVSANMVIINGEKYILGFHRDITERKRSEELIKNILESVDEGFIILDRDFRILSANKAYANMVAMPLQNIIGGHCYEVSHRGSTPCSGTGCDCAVKKVFETRTSHVSVHAHHDSKGGLVHIETKAYPLSKDGSGEVVTAIETLVDITERQKLEEQLRQSQKMESIGTLAGGIAHDFNNILTAIIGYGHLVLMKMAKDDPQRLNIEHMLEAGDRAAHLTKDLLLFGRKQISERKAVDLNEIIGRVERFLVRVIGEDVDCRTILSNEAMPVLGDSHQLEQVLMNLATNARDAMPAGGIFTVATAQARFDEKFITVHGFGKPGSYVLASITDTGKGMDDETKERIFEPFFTTKEAGKGTGLGLAVVYGIIKQHEGFINVYSEPGRGTTFRIYLPLIAAGVDEQKKPAEERPLGGTETILLAEDDEAVRNLTRSVLEDFGYSVITAIDGRDAVIKYRENKDKIRLLLLDLIMPGMTGMEAYDEIRTMTPGVKVLFVTGYAPDMVRQKVLIDDKMPVLFKPTSPTELLRQVRKTLDT